MSKPIVRPCLANSTTSGRPTYPRPITATVDTFQTPSTNAICQRRRARLAQRAFDGVEVRAHERLDAALGIGGAGGATVEDDARGVVAAAEQEAGGTAHLGSDV